MREVEFKKQFVIFKEISRITVPAKFYIFWDPLAEYVPPKVKHLFRDTGRGRFILELEWKGKYSIPLQMRRGHSFFEAPDEDNEGIIFKTLPGEGRKLEVKVPKQSLKDFKVRYTLFETGTGLSNTGHSQIICDLSGKPLKPFLKRFLFGEPHAYFNLWEGQEACVIRTSHHHKIFRVNLSLFYAKRSFPKVVTLWEASEFERENLNDVLPEKFENFKTAIESAIDKALCYHCRTPHYYQRKEG